MENYKESFEKKIKNKGFHVKSVLLALGLTLGISSFSYSQNNGGTASNKAEQVSKTGERNFETYKIRIYDRNKNIEEKTSETLEQFATRLGTQLELEVKKNLNIEQKIDEIKSILNNKYSQNIGSNNPLVILQTALKIIGNSNDYEGMEQYSKNFSGKYDINFIDAIGYLQYMNNLSDNGNLIGKNGELTLEKIIYNLNQRANNSEVEFILKDRPYTLKQNEPILQKNELEQNTQIQHGTYKGDSTEDKTTNNCIETSKVINDNKVHGINSGYIAKVKNRDNNITGKTSETLDDFADRINKQFLNEANDKNSLISKKMLGIKNLLDYKFHSKLNNNPITIIQLALIELSKTEKYKGLQEYSDNFSGNFDINFINAYGFVQYINDWNCNWALCGKDGALILQSIYDDLNNIRNGNVTVDKSNSLNSSFELPKNENNDSNNAISTIKSEDSKEPKQNPNPKQKIEPNDNEKIDDDRTINIEPYDRNLEGISLLSNSLSPDKLNGITYEDVWNTVEGFKHEGLRNAVMNCLLHNDVIGAQRLLGMDINCNKKLYPDYVASTRIGQRELDLMERLGESRRYMDTQEILKFMERVEKAYEIENYEVKTAYLKFLSGELNNAGLPYCIISKYDYKMYLFSADHKLLSCQSVLTGAHVGDHPNDPKNGYHTTPGGMYEIGGLFDKSSEGKNLVAVYGTQYFLTMGLNGQYHYSEEYTMGIHGYVKGRERRLSSENSIDHRVSNGCINVNRATFGELTNHLKIGSRIYICRDDE